MIEIEKYLELYKKIPHHFKYNKEINIVSDKAELVEYANKNNCKLGVVFENDYFSLVVDLIENSSGKRYTYARIINRNEYNGVVIIPLLNNRIIFLKQFRHGTREYEIELPRGFSDGDKTAQGNAENEIFEELGVSTTKIAYLGNVVSNTGLSGGLVHIFICEIESVGNLSVDEGIKETIQLSLLEAEEYIKQNRIRDCFTLSAICKLKTADKFDGSAKNVFRFA